eukprot:COSAG06_NODE_4124_length_4547_cov_1.723696_1_plen_48_part_10
MIELAPALGLLARGRARCGTVFSEGDKDEQHAVCFPECLGKRDELVAI